jgi:hypothetical protein
VAVLGGSTAWGLGASANSRTISGQLEQCLGEAGGDSRVMSAAYPAWASREELVTLLEYREVLDPDVVLAVTGFNDLLVLSLAVGAVSAALPASGAADAHARSGPVGAAAGAPGWLRDGERLVRIGQRDPDSGDLLDVRFFETDADFRLRRSVHAAQARVEGQRWELRAPREQRFDPVRPAAASRPAPAPTWLPAPETDPRPPLASAAWAEVRSAASRAVVTASAPVLALLAIAVGLGVRASGSLANQALSALALAALFRAASQAAAFVTDRWALPAALAAALVLAAFALAAAALWTRTLR